MLEVIAFNIASCVVAQEHGAQRIELCDNPEEGGTTPSLGFIKAAREKLSIDLFPIIRPRGGDFLYSADEYAIMRTDILLCKEAGCNGVVIGMLNEDGSIDKQRVQALVELAYPMSVTFHRAFDRAADPLQSLEDVIATGCERILTSGQRPNVIEGIPLIKELIEKAAHRIIIMPGSGVRSDTIREIAESTGAEDFHTSARTSTGSNMRFLVPGMNEDLRQTTCDGREVARIAALLKELSLYDRYRTG